MIYLRTSGEIVAVHRWTIIALLQRESEFQPTLERQNSSGERTSTRCRIYHTATFILHSAKEDKSGNKHDKKRSWLSNTDKRSMVIFGAAGKTEKRSLMKSSQDMREPHLCQSKGSVKAEPIFILSCCSKPHIHHSGPQKGPSQATVEGCRLPPATIDDPEGLGDGGRRCLCVTIKGRERPLDLHRGTNWVEYGAKLLNRVLLLHIIQFGKN